MNGGGLVEGVEKNSKWPQVERQIDLGMEEQWKNDGTEKRMAQAWWKPDRAVKRHLQTSQKSGINELMRCMDNKYKFIPRLVFQLEETVPGLTYSVENQLDKTSIWSWKPFAVS